MTHYVINEFKRQYYSWWKLHIAYFHRRGHSFPDFWCFGSSLDVYSLRNFFHTSIYLTDLVKYVTKIIENEWNRDFNRHTSISTMLVIEINNAIDVNSLQAVLTYVGLPRIWSPFSLHQSWAQIIGSQFHLLFHPSLQSLPHKNMHALFISYILSSYLISYYMHAQSKGSMFQTSNIQQQQQQQQRLIPLGGVGYMDQLPP